MITVKRQCPMCLRINTLTVPKEGYSLWLNRRALIQDALPNLTDNEREMLKTGICPRCWNKIFN